MAEKLNKDAVYRAAKKDTKDYMLNDGGGLYLVVGKSGTKLWRFVYTFDSKRKKIALGAYPENTLETARRKAEEARENIAKGIDPADIRTEDKKARQLVKLNDDRINDGLPIVNSFKDLAYKWLDSDTHLTNALTKKKKTERLERSAFPRLGDNAADEPACFQGMKEGVLILNNVGI